MVKENGGKIQGRALSGYDRADLLFDFSVAYADGVNLVRDFGNGKEYSPAEVHMITRIAENPGITVTELARRGNRTKGAISQVVKRLEEKGLVEKRKAAEIAAEPCSMPQKKAGGWDNATRSEISGELSGWKRSWKPKWAERRWINFMMCWLVCMKL